MVQLPESIRKSYLRQFAAAVAVVVAAILFAGLVLQGIAADDLEAQATAEIELTAETSATDLQAWMERTEHTTLLIADDETFERDDRDEIETLLYQRLTELPNEYTGIHYVDARTGEIEATTSQELAGRSIETLGFDWHDAAGDARAVPVEPGAGVVTSDVSTAGERPQLAFATPTDGTHAIVLTAGITTRALAFETAFEGSRAQVVNADGVVQIDRDEERVGESIDQANRAALARSLDGDVGTVRGGQETIVGYSPVEGTDWGLLVYTPEDEALAVQSDVNQLLIALVGISLAGFVFLGATIGRTTVRELRTLSTKAEQLERGDFETELESDRADEIGQLFDAFAGMRDSLESRIEDAEAAQQEAAQQREQAEEAADRAERLAADAEARSDRLERRATAYSQVMNACAEGDLTRRLESDVDNEAMIEIATAFNGMIADIEATIRELQTFAETVTEASEEADVGAREVTEASEEVSESMQAIATGADDQRANLEEIVGEMNAFSATIEEVASTTQNVATQSDEAARIASEGEATVTDTLAEMDEFQQAMASTVETVEQLDELVVEIDEIVELIAEIADQTNLLALNANIEAANAGTGSENAGAGFAVVAEEVKQLAEETQASAGEVADLVATVQTQTDTTVAEVRDAERRIQSTRQSMESAADAFADAADEIAGTNEGVQDIASAMDEQAASVEEVARKIDDVQTISQETASESETVSAAAEEQVSSITQVTSNVESLAEQADRLRAQLAEFTVGTSTDR